MKKAQKRLRIFHGGVVIPDEFICPISQQIMLDPVSTTNQHHFDRTSIQPWLDAHGTCPMTREEMPTYEGKYPVFPLPNLRQNILEFIETNREDPNVQAHIPDGSNVQPSYKDKLVRLDEDEFDVFIENELTRDNQKINPHEDPENKFVVLAHENDELVLQHIQSDGICEEVNVNKVTFIM